jgi:hypothetical protein
VCVAERRSIKEKEEDELFFLPLSPHSKQYLFSSSCISSARTDVGSSFVLVSLSRSSPKKSKE